MLNFNTAQEASFGRVTVESGSLEDRLVFIKKVYTLLAASMATAAIGAYLGTGPLLPIVASNRMILFILMIGLIFFAQFARHKPGLNMIALFSFTTVSGLTLGPLLYAVGPSIATQAFALTAIRSSTHTLFVNLAATTKASRLCKLVLLTWTSIQISILLKASLLKLS